MSWSPLVILTIVTAISAINRPVYKVVLTQKGYTQYLLKKFDSSHKVLRCDGKVVRSQLYSFLQYDLETPPLREFTFCTWFRTYDLGADQSIFTYVANGNSRVLRLWLDSGGKFLKVSISGQVTSRIPVDILKDVWRHLCLSYQSDYGAWAVYIDAKLALCESNQKLYDFVLPAAGSVIIGYGPTDEDKPNGFEGEMFGANMLLVSTIERNHSISVEEHYQEMRFKKNKIKDGEQEIKYVVFGDLQTEEIHNNFEKTPRPTSVTKSKSFIKINTPHSSVSHDVGVERSTTPTKTYDLSNEKEFLDFPSNIEVKTERNRNNFWDNMAKPVERPKPKPSNKIPRNEISSSSTKDLVMISEYETPPPPQPSPAANSFYMSKDNFKTDIKQYFKKPTPVILPNVETPPPLQKDNKVYGQWTSSKFAGSVLNYLKSINYHSREKKVPVTIPLPKISDSYPYASDFKVSKVRPSSQFQRKNFMDHKIRLHKRGVNNMPEINVKIIEGDLRSTILKMHAVTEPKNVEVTSRGEAAKIMDHRFYRNANVSAISSEDSNSFENPFKPRPFSNVITRMKPKKVTTDLESYKNHNLMTILPFLKTLEYFVEDQHYKSQVKDNIQRSSDMYSKSLSNGNKWHNIKTYNNDYTPRRIKADLSDGSSDIEYNVAEANKKHPSLRLNYKHDGNKNTPAQNGPEILKGIEIAKGVSKQSNPDKDSISIIKYNHGYLPSQEPKHNTKSASKAHTKHEQGKSKSNFNKQVKLGNALNERHVIGDNDDQKKQSFVGGNEKVPDIHRYRSAIDNENANVPSSLNPRTCKNSNSGSRPLYIQHDESIIVSHIESPLRKKNIAVQFIQLNYNECSLQGSNFERSYLLFIDWRKTPVRLFGGAQARKTTDLCGFF